MSISDKQLQQVIDILFQQYDGNANGFLEPKEITQMINLTLRHNDVHRKFSIQ